MKVVRDDMWFCVDCMQLSVNGDPPHDGTHAEISKLVAGLRSLGEHIVPDFDIETGEGYDAFCPDKCDCCGNRLSGERYRFAQLGV